jgi:hypothetical protein
LPAHLPAPYCELSRGIDQYGFVPFDGNFFWVPGGKREEVKVLRYANHLEIYQHRVCVAKYPLPADGVKNERISPEGQPAPRHMPRHRTGSQPEEKRLRAMGQEVAAYVDFVAKTPGVQRHRLLRELFALSQKVTQAVFLEAVARALRYRIVQISTLERITWLCMSQSRHHLPYVDFDENFRQRPAYQEGCLTDEPDLSRLDPPQAGDQTRPDEDTPAPPESETPHE